MNGTILIWHIRYHHPHYPLYHYPHPLLQAPFPFPILNHPCIIDLTLPLSNHIRFDDDITMTCWWCWWWWLWWWWWCHDVMGSWWCHDDVMIIWCHRVLMWCWCNRCHACLLMMSSQCRHHHSYDITTMMTSLCWHHHADARWRARMPSPCPPTSVSSPCSPSDYSRRRRWT